MRYFKTGLIVVLLLSVLLSASIVAFASEEETDWSQVDWNQVDWYQIDWNQVDWENTDIRAMIMAMYSRLYEDTEGKRLSRFWDWAENEASWHILFKISMHTDAASAEAASGVIYDRFAVDPYGLIRALAQEEAAVQEEVIRKLCYGGYHPDVFGRVLGSVQLPDTATEEERTVWQAILAHAEERWDVVPVTGDGIYAPVALLLASALGLAALVVNKKRFA